MLSVDFFSGSRLNQFLRTLIAFVFLMVSDIVYYFGTGGVFYGTQFNLTKFPFIPYLTLWIILGTLFGIIEFKNVKMNNTDSDDSKSTIAKDSSLFGLITALVVYGILVTFMFYPNGKSFSGIWNMTFGIVICAISCMFTHLIATNNNLYG
jgi:hypothetical protein